MDLLSISLPTKAIKLSFFDTDGKKINGITVEQANTIAKLDPKTKFYFQTGDGVEQELNIEQVNQLKPENLLPTAPNCPTEPQVCGPPLVKFFGGGGFGAAANAIISPISSSVIGFDIVSAGKEFLSTPNAEIVDNCGKGSGASLTVNMEEYDDEDFAEESLGREVDTETDEETDETNRLGKNKEENKNGNRYRKKKKKKKRRVKNITIDAPGDGYIPEPDGSLGGNERVWKEPDEGYVKTKDGAYYVVQPYRPIKVKKGDTYYAPDKPPRVLEEDEIINLSLVPVKQKKPIQTKPLGTPYSVILCIEEIKVLDKGFGYRPGDKLIITPNNGTQAELIINEFGHITGVKILKGGCGYNDIPVIKTDSPTGFNATFSPIFKVTQVDPTKPIETQVDPRVTESKDPKDPQSVRFTVPNQVELVTVIDCVGKFAPSRTFNVPR